MLAQQAHNIDLVAIGNRELLLSRASALSLPLNLHTFHENTEASRLPAGELRLINVPITDTAIPGQLNSNNAAYVLETLDIAANGCMSGLFNAMVTAPVHKGVINDANIEFTGHTEYLAGKSGSYPVMLLANDTFRVALATTHMPLSAVPAAITEPTLIRVLNVLHDELKKRFNIDKPHIVVCGLNPHAGEQGHLGHEEIDIIEPALERLREQGMHLSGPLPADTLFTPHHLSDADAVLAMYHDQGLPVLKYAGFGNSVNITLGLPFIRTSVDHGTAIDKAATGNIDSGSLKAALLAAQQMVQAQAEYPGS